MPRIISYEIEDCFGCTFYEDTYNDYDYDGTFDSRCKHYPVKTFMYPEDDKFPDFCPLEKVVD